MTAENFIADILIEGRICPMPPHWANLWKMLPKQPNGTEPPLPLILGAWWNTEDDDKRERFRLHLRWADEHEALERVAEFINSLKPQDWHTES